MKKMITLFLAIFLFSSCIVNVDNIPDSDFFKSFEPLEWSDDYVFLPTDFPQQIQVWNSKTKKLVYTYELLKEMTVHGKKIERAISINDMLIVDKDIWLSGTGVNNNLIKINVPTGKVEYINQKDNFYSMKLIKDFKTDENFLLLKNPYEVDGGFKIWKYDLNGKVIKEKKININRLSVLEFDNLKEFNDEYLMIGALDYDITTSSNKDIFSIINLNKGHSTLFSSKIFYISKVISDLKYDFEEFSCTLYSLNTNYNDYAILNMAGFANGDTRCARFLFKINEWTDSKIDVKYTGINYQDDEARAICSLSENDKNIFLTGRILYGNGFSGLETGVYSKATGKELYRMRMANSNQLHYEIKNDKTWFPQNVRLQDENYNWYSIPKGCYMLDHKTGKTYWYDENGNEKEIKQILVE